MAVVRCVRGIGGTSSSSSLRRLIATGAKGFGGGKRGFGGGGGKGRRSKGEGEEGEGGRGDAPLPAWKAPLEVLLYPDPRLRAENVAVTRFGTELEELSKEMLRVMYATDGVGLAAPQVGVNVRLMVYNEEGDPTKGKEYVLCNPSIVSKGFRQGWFKEGCLSFPKIYGNVKRPNAITVKAQDTAGRWFEMKLNDFQARVFQHEYDHLQGVLFHDRMPEDVVESIRPELLMLEDKWKAGKKGSLPETVSTRLEEIA